MKKNASETPPVTVWLVEDYAPFRNTVSRLLNATNGLACTHLFATGEDALRSLQTQPKPNVIMLDVGLPGMNGLELLAKVREVSPDTRVVILTAFEDEEKIFRAICSGASGYLLKTATADQITGAIAEAVAGGAPMTPSIAKRVLEMFSRMAPAKTDYGLSDREKMVLEARSKHEDWGSGQGAQGKAGLRFRGTRHRSDGNCRSWKRGVSWITRTACLRWQCGSGVRACVRGSLWARSWRCRAVCFC